MGDVDGAIAALEEAVRASPIAPTRTTSSASCTYGEGRSARALAELEAALALDPDDVSARMVHQELLLERGEV